MNIFFYVMQSQLEYVKLQNMIFTYLFETNFNHNEFDYLYYSLKNGYELTLT